MHVVFVDRESGPEKLVCEAEVVFGLFDLASRRLVRPTERWLAALGLARGSEGVGDTAGEG